MHPDSLLHLHRRLLHLRQSMPILQRGTLEVINTGNGFVLGIKRELGSERAYIYINFANAPQHFFIPEHTEIIASTHPHRPTIDNHQQLTIQKYCGVLLLPQNNG